MISTLSQSERACRLKSRSVSFFCDYLGISRQGYNKHEERRDELDILRTSIILYCKSLRRQLPRSGMRELYELCRRKFGEKFTIGRDQCYALFRSNGLVLRSRKRPRTTCSNHNYFIYPDMLNTTPKLKAEKFGRLCVTDITYVACAKGWAYLSLVTDAASRMIIGYALHPTLDKDGPIEALNRALAFYESRSVDLQGLIHHSDRGSQYCCNKYVEILKSKGVRISMTQTGDPLHNALAERMNNTVKNGWLFDTGQLDYGQLSQAVDKAIRAYNSLRPHQSLAMRTPYEQMQMLTQSH